MSGSRHGSVTEEPGERTPASSAEPAPPADSLASPRSRALFVFAAAAFVLSFLFVKPVFQGDGHQYYTMLQAWQDHGTPDIREADIRQARELLVGHGLIAPTLSFSTELARAGNGRSFYWHFWLYPLCALPAKLLLHLARANECAAFQVTNALLFVAALGATLFGCRSPLRRRVAFLGLASVSPVLAYLRWPHPEVFTWAAVVISLTLLRNRRYAGAALAASCAAMQNPPALFLALYAVLMSLRERDCRRTFWAAAGALPALSPMLFCKVTFGVLNLVAAHGFSSTHMVSPARTWSFFADLNQGMLPYVPLLLFLAAAGLGRAAVRRSAAGVGLGIVILLAVLACETTTNWNNACVGMMRYAVWVVPMLAWLAAEHLPATRGVFRAIALAVAIQGVIAWQYQGRFDYLTQSPLAVFVFNHAPALYNPDVEIFCERQVHGGCDFRKAFPMGFVRPDGTVAKVLTDAHGLARLGQICVIRPDYLAAMEHRLQRGDGPLYFTPPAGAMQMMAQR